LIICQTPPAWSFAAKLNGSRSAVSRLPFYQFHGTLSKHRFNCRVFYSAAAYYGTIIFSWKRKANISKFM
jgi:hypothetical protein